MKEAIVAFVYCALRLEYEHKRAHMHPTEFVLEPAPTLDQAFDIVVDIDSRFDAMYHEREPMAPRAVEAEAVVESPATDAVE